MRTLGRALLQLSWFVLAILGIGSSAAAASTLWAYSGGNSLFPIDVATGAVGIPVAISGASVTYTDLAGALKSQGALVWAISSFSSDNRLSAMDPVTKQILSSVSISTPQKISSLAIDPATGEFYGASSTSLYRISPTTGATTLVGATALPVDKALGFDRLGDLYGIANENQLVAVDKATGATSLVAILGVLRMEDIAVRPETGVMYGIGYGPGYSLYQINLTTGSLINLGPSLSRPTGLAFAAVPEMGTLILAAVASVLIILTAFSRRYSWG